MSTQRVMVECSTASRPPCLDFQPAPVLAPITLFARDSAVVGFDFSPKAFGDFAGDAFTAREGDLGFTIANGMPKEGHDIVRMEFLGPRALAVLIFTCISCPYPNLARQEWK